MYICPLNISRKVNLFSLIPLKSLNRLNKYFFKYKKLLLLGVLFVILSNGLLTLSARVTGYAIDLVTENLNTLSYFEGTSQKEAFFKSISWSFLVFGLVYIGIALLKGFFSFLTRQTIIVMSRNVEFDLKNEIYNHYQQLPLSFYRANNTGDLMNRISDDVSKVRMYIGPAVMYGLNLLVLFALVIPYMFMVNTKLAFYTLLPLPILSVSIYYVSNKVNVQSEKIQSKLSSLSTFVQEAFSGIRVLKAFAREQSSVKNFDILSTEFKEESLKLAKINAFFFPLISTLIGLSTILTVYVGGKEVIEGNITLGNIAEFIIYVNMLTWPVTSLGWITSIVQRAAASQTRINEFIETHSEIQNGAHPLVFHHHLRFENVTLTYPESNITALKNVSFEVKKGETLAILGKTGCGKSSLANLLCRMIDPSAGRILVDQVPLTDIDLKSYRSALGYVPQESFLFSDSIKNNILFGQDGLTDEHLEKATQDADVFQNIMDFEHKFDTLLGERGITLSGGQKQRVTIARAIIRNPQILILDDCLSAVDTQTEDKILGNLQGIMEGNTSIIISHRASTVKLADRIMVLSDGELAEIGSHSELMIQNGLYKEIFDSQLDE